MEAILFIANASLFALALFLGYLAFYLSIKSLLHHGRGIRKYLFAGYLLLLVLFIFQLLSINWVGNKLADTLTSVSFISVLYLILFLVFRDKYSSKLSTHRAREAFGEHILHIRDEDLHQHLKH